MTESDAETKPSWVASVYYASSHVGCSLERAWKVLLDYEAWNPTFMGAQVTPVSGQYRTEGELVLISKSLADVNGELEPAYYAETVKVIPFQHIVWYAYPQDGNWFRNFVDFGLTEVPSGVNFNIYYYEQNFLSGELLTHQRAAYQASFHDLAAAFKQYCEGRA